MRGHKDSYFSVIIKWALSKLDLVIAKKMSKYYEVAKILAVRSIDGHKEYRVEGFLKQGRYLGAGRRLQQRNEECE